MRKALDGMSLAFIGFVVIVAVICLPFATLWSLNTLFPVLAIPYNFWTWLAMVVFYGFFKTKVEVQK